MSFESLSMLGFSQARVKIRTYEERDDAMMSTENTTHSSCYLVTHQTSQMCLSVLGADCEVNSCLFPLEHCRKRWLLISKEAGMLGILGVTYMEWKMEV